MKPTKTQRSIADLRELLADVPMPALTRHWVDCHLRDLQKDADCGALSEERAKELEEIESEIEDISWRIRSHRRYA